VETVPALLAAPPAELNALVADSGDALFAPAKVGTVECLSQPAENSTASAASKNLVLVIIFIPIVEVLAEIETVEIETRCARYALSRFRKRAIGF
jgi:hypothetical protein